MLTRRGFLGALAAGGAGLALQGCAPLGWLEPAPSTSAIVAPSAAETDLVAHVLARLTYGAAPGDRAEVERLGVDAWFEAQLDPERIPDDACQRAVRRLELLADPVGELYEHRREVVARELSRAALLRAVGSRRQLHERMAGFWSDHFTVSMGKADCAWLAPDHDRRVARAHALGRFRDLLRAATLSPAMLWYLDGRANRADGGAPPNENHARELLELHTLGVHGGYGQADVLAVARCLSGWTARPRDGWRKGAVEFVAAHHDDGEKTVLGARIPAGGGPADVERVLDVLCVHPATARHIATKLCRRFIADDPPSGAVEAVAAAFSASRGGIRECLRALVARPEFRAEAPEWRHVRGAKLKRPFQWVASVLRACDARTDAGPALAEHLSALGEAPFRCPTPDGYADEAEPWRHGLLWRWKLAADLAAGRVAGTSIDVARLVERSGSPEALAAHLLQRRPDDGERAAIAGLSAEHALAVLIASPAFQRC